MICMRVKSCVITNKMFKTEKKRTHLLTRCNIMKRLYKISNYWLLHFSHQVVRVDAHTSTVT